jgi:hypothetical protein
MTRTTLRRYVERLALTSLLGGGACGQKAPPAQDMNVTLSDGGADLACPVLAPGGCYWYVYVDGLKPSDTVQYWRGDGGVDPCGPCAFETIAGTYCGECEIVANACGTAYFCAILDCNASCNSSGRRPAGLVLPSLASLGGRGDELARRAHLEAASVPAFAQLARELAAHGAPERLIAGARRALADEERHAQMMGDLARRAGARLLPLDVAPTPLRPLAELALENAVEGCVRETVGAVAARLEARRIVERPLADIFGAIAVDETRHANLAWAVDAWAARRLAPAERRRIEVARAAALAELLAA